MMSFGTGFTVFVLLYFFVVVALVTYAVLDRLAKRRKGRLAGLMCRVFGHQGESVRMFLYGKMTEAAEGANRANLRLALSCVRCGVVFAEWDGQRWTSQVYPGKRGGRG